MYKIVGIAGFAVIAMTGECFAADERPVAFQWEGFADPIAGVATREDATSGKLRIRLPNPNRDCIGTLANALGVADGTWGIACPDSLVASGQFKGKGDGEGVEGIGRDSQGRQVVFVIAPRIGGSNLPARPPQDGSAPSEVSCDKIRISGLAIPAAAVKCASKTGTGSIPSADRTVDSFSANWSGKHLSVTILRVVGRSYFAHIGRDELKTQIERDIGTASAPTDWEYKDSPVRHFRFKGRFGGADYSCARGYFSTESNAEGMRNLIWFYYCERGTHRIADAAVSSAYGAVRVN